MALPFGENGGFKRIVNRQIFSKKGYGNFTLPTILHIWTSYPQCLHKLRRFGKILLWSFELLVIDLKCSVTSQNEKHGRWFSMTQRLIICRLNGEVWTFAVISLNIKGMLVILNVLSQQAHSQPLNIWLQTTPSDLPSFPLPTIRFQSCVFSRDPLSFAYPLSFSIYSTHFLPLSVWLRASLSYILLVSHWIDPIQFSVC